MIPVLYLKLLIRLANKIENILNIEKILFSLPTYASITRVQF